MEEVDDISKEELRQYAKSMRRNIVNKDKKDLIILKKVLEDEMVKKNQNILIYISRKDEVSTQELILEFFKLNKNVYVPRTNLSDMNFYKINSFKELKLGRFNIKEPIGNYKFKEKDGVIIVPGLLFDKNNNRLGYGKGYYDKFLKDKNLYKIGLSYSKFCLDEIEVNDFDIKMDKVITER